ncbi:acyl-CoA thioesterase [Emcibacter sp. SYSU 3D8]|uniref:acyl-CoA thioesterase n=1 Tax=Emcibacter sp. SYSU 3D8 TaxID=3133969 RepID=UPI0031FE951D
MPQKTAEEFLGLKPTHNPHRWILPVVDAVATPGNFLFGGCGLAAAISAMEQTCGRPAVWATAQYLSYARPPSIMDLDVIVPVSGKSSTQARVVGHVGDTEILTVNAALGSRDMELSGQWATPPDVARPDDCDPVPRWSKREGFIDSRVELRVARGRWGMHDDGTPGDGRAVLWARIPEGVEMTAPMLAVIADKMPAGFSGALGHRVGGNSLDNTIRIHQIRPTEWVLCDIQVHAVHAGYGHGRMHLWSDDGVLLATASQSAIMRIHNETPKG